MKPVRAVLMLLGAVCVVAGSLAAQDAQVRAPLRPPADHVRSVIPAPALPGLLVEAPPRVGLFRTAGLPAGLPRDVTSSRGVLQLGVFDGSGGYRRPFDQRSVRTAGARAAGWQRLGERGAAWGRVAVEDGGPRLAGFASHVRPYGSAPLVLADTSNPKLDRARAVLEGAMGWQAGPWLVGVAGGLEVIDDGTRDALFIKTNRTSVPAFQVSAGRDIPGGMTVVVHGRWTGGSETIFLRPEPQPSRAFVLTGFDDPQPTDVVPPGALFRRTQRDGYAGGLGVSGRLLGAPWVVSAERTYRKDIHFSEPRQDPPSDDWVADGWAAVAAHQRSLPFGLVGTLHIDFSRLVGDVTLAGVDGVVTRVRETLIDGLLDVRWSPADSPVSGALRLGLGRSSRNLHDFLVRVGADLLVWHSSAVAEVVYRFGETAVGVAGGVAGNGPYATLPRPDAMGPAYQQMIAPAWSRDATCSTTVVGGLTIRQQLSPGLALLARTEVANMTPRGAPVTASPDGFAREWRFEVGVIGGR